MAESSAYLDTKYTILIWTIGFAGLILGAAIVFGG